MKRIIFCLLFAFVFCAFNSCTKYGDSDDAAELMVEGGGFIKMVSQSNNPYDIYIDDEYQGSIQGKKSKTYTVVADEEHKVYVKQISGYTFWATTETYHITVGKGKTYTKNFPQSSLGKNNGEE